MVMKGKPKLSPLSPASNELPPETAAWAKSADIPVNEGIAQQETVATAPSTGEEEDLGMPLREAKSPVSLRLTPSVQRRLKRVLFQLTDRSGTRVTLQDLLEKFVMDGLKREEAKLQK